MFSKKYGQALVVLRLKRYLIIYSYAAVTAIWLAVVIKTNHEQLPPLETCFDGLCILEAVTQEVLEKAVFWKIQHNSLCAGVSFFSKAAGFLRANTFLMKYLRVTVLSRYPEELLRKFLKNSQENTREEVLF